MVIAKNTMPANDLKRLIAWLKANPGKASAGTAGVGSPGHVFGVLFQNVTDTSLQFVPYRGTAPAMQDLVAGQIDMMIDDPTNSVPHVLAGRIKAYAVMARTRLATAPSIPTADEAGLSGFYLSHWHASGLQRVRRKTLPQTSMPRSRKPWPTLLYARGSPILGRTFSLENDKRRKRFTPIRRTRSRNGGRSSRRQGLRENKAAIDHLKSVRLAADLLHRKSAEPGKAGCALQRLISTAVRNITDNTT
jgi:hypothetical protein